MSSQQSSRGSAYSSTASSPYQHAYYYYDAPPQAATWMKVIPIEDDELTFGGKPLSDWHEEDLRRYSSSSFETDEHRGRTRQRAYYEPTSSGSTSGHTSSGHHHKHGHGHKHHHKKSDKKK